MIRYFCDLCGKECKKFVDLEAVAVDVRITGEYTKTIKVGEICGDCLTSISRIVANEVRELNSEIIRFKNEITSLKKEES